MEIVQSLSSWKMSQKSPS